jgi:hypothetical protein
VNLGAQSEVLTRKQQHRMFKECIEQHVRSLRIQGGSEVEADHFRGEQRMKGENGHDWDSGSSWMSGTRFSAGSDLAGPGGPDSHGIVPVLTCPLLPS